MEGTRRLPHKRSDGKHDLRSFRMPNGWIKRLHSTHDKKIVGCADRGRKHSMIKKFDHWINKRLRQNKGSLIVAEQNQYWQYYTYPSKDYDDRFLFFNDRPQHRKILVHEIIIETDHKSKEENYEVSKKIEKVLEKKKYSYTKWYSGNKSYHFHLFFPNLKLITEKHELKILKGSIIKEAFPKSVGELKIDMQLTGQHLIRAEYSLHPKTQNYKVLLKTYTALRRINIEPLTCWQTLIEEKKAMSKNKKRFFSLPLKRECVKYFLTHYLMDTKKRALFYLAGQLKKVYSKQELTLILMDWNDTIQKKQLSRTSINSTIRSVYQSKESPGCAYAKELLAELKKTEVCKKCFKKI